MLLLLIIIIIIIKCWMLSFIVCVCVIYFFFFFKIFYILYKRKKKLLYFALLWTASHGAFINLSLCQFTLFMSYLLFLKGGNKVTVNFKYWLKPYNLHMLCFASLMYNNGLIVNQKKKKKKSSTLWSAFVSQSVCAGASGFTVVINSFVVAFTLFKMSLKKEKCTYWCFIVKGCVKGPARF